MLLKELCQINGVSGNEKRVRDFILERIQDKVDSWQMDKIGNLVVKKKPSSSDQPIVLLCAHMDEVGLFITEITADGYLKFQPVGGIDPQILVSKPVSIGSIQGVIGTKAIHLQRKEERKQILNFEELYIDIGANTKEEAEKEVKIGDYAFFNSHFEIIGQDYLKAKALDDRIGCALIMEILDSSFACGIIAAFTVQEEIGLRGSKVISNYVQPDFAIIVEATRAADIEEENEEAWSVELSKGPACSLMDSATIYQSRLIQKVSNIARNHHIPLQFRKSTAAANDAGNIHKGGTGVPTITLSVPCRNIHSMSSVICKTDYEYCLSLLRLILQGGFINAESEYP
ncbi:MAG: putative aminopeptidase YsdC [Candidatus Dichloromethanomonas elyunquensis]|nr:MAG: putative aminopeptidase YsdC [Candidatus Dichloromethanomonas elyunquensis]